jgi:hypothetical protein
VKTVDVDEDDDDDDEDKDAMMQLFFIDPLCEFKIFML